MAHKICFINQKGGVGKTTLTFHTSGALAEFGKKVLIIDLDAQGNLSFCFFDDKEAIPLTVNDILKEDGEEIAKIISKTDFDKIDIVPANKKLRDLDTRLASQYDAQFYLMDELQDIESKYDYILMDCPPSLGIATRMALVATNYVVIPIESEGFSLEGSAQIVSYILEAQKRANPNLKLMGFVFNKLDLRRDSEKGYREILKEQYNDTLFRTEFKRSVKYREAYLFGKKPINFYRPVSDEAETARAFVKEIISYVEKN